ncbi:hypothetical protein CEXT_250751 [Caerostris extrusa]|uniref:Uncharacterized protein n=1 Tax=Caerostris extrusa TaxID=172846 RepID=A0AAV4PN75_CAEEX|nr:hypothetical protein CEXT_250751 [Caerostris extrusa]
MRSRHENGWHLRESFDRVLKMNVYTDIFVGLLMERRSQQNRKRWRWVGKGAYCNNLRVKDFTTHRVGSVRIVLAKTVDVLSEMDSKETGLIRSSHAKEKRVTALMQEVSPGADGLIVCSRYKRLKNGE